MDQVIEKRNWGWTGKNNKTPNYFKQLYYT